MGYRRFVALGDSTTEGLVDVYPDGRFRGWADRLADRLAELEPGLLYANLAVRGKRAFQVREDQLEPALALRPDLASLLAGLNDLLRRNCDVAGVAAEIEAMVVSLRAAGADVLLFTLPDPVKVNPLARAAAVRLRALNAAVRDIAARHGALVVDLDRTPVASIRACGRSTACTPTRRAITGSPPARPTCSSCPAATTPGARTSPTRTPAAPPPRTPCGPAATSPRG